MTPDETIGNGEDLGRQVAFPQGSKAFLPRNAMSHTLAQCCILRDKKCSYASRPGQCYSQMNEPSVFASLAFRLKLHPYFEHIQRLRISNVHNFAQGAKKSHLTSRSCYNSTGGTSKGHFSRIEVDSRCSHIGHPLIGSCVIVFLFSINH